MPRSVIGRAGGDRSGRSRTKKLIVAFHFQFANQAGWECDACRRAGLENKRRCGFSQQRPPASGAAPVWARKAAAVEECPKSYVTPQSHALLEEFLVLRRLGGLYAAGLSAKQVEAFVILEAELELEREDAERER